MILSLGLDISSTSTGAVLLEGNWGRLAKVIYENAWKPPASLDVLDRAHWQAQVLLTLIEELEPKDAVVTLENYGGQFVGSIIPIVTVGTLLRYTLRLNGFKWWEVAPNQLKKFVLAGSKKEDIKLQVYKQFGFEHVSNDVIDAYVLAQLGLGLADEFYKEIGQNQQEVIDALKSPKKKSKKHMQSLANPI